MQADTNESETSLETSEHNSSTSSDSGISQISGEQEEWTYSLFSDILITLHLGAAGVFLAYSVKNLLVEIYLPTVASFGSHAAMFTAFVKSFYSIGTIILRPEVFISVLVILASLYIGKELGNFRVLRIIGKQLAYLLSRRLLHHAHIGLIQIDWSLYPLFCIGAMLLRVVSFPIDTLYDLKEMKEFLQRRFGNLPDRAPWWFNFVIVVILGFLCSILHTAFVEIGLTVVDTYHYIRGNSQPKASVIVVIKRLQCFFLPISFFIFVAMAMYLYGIYKLKTALRKYIFYRRGLLSLSDYINVS